MYWIDELRKFEENGLLRSAAVPTIEYNIDCILKDLPSNFFINDDKITLPVKISRHYGKKHSLGTAGGLIYEELKRNKYIFKNKLTKKGEEAIKNLDCRNCKERFKCYTR